MTKSELIVRLAESHSRLTAKDAELAVETILKAMSESLSKGKRIEIRGFGSFTLNYRSPSIACHPQSGVQFRVEGGYLPHFKPGKALKESVNMPH